MSTHRKTAKKRPTKPLNGTTVRMPGDLRTRLDKLALRHGLKPSDLIRNALWVKLPEWEKHGVTMAVTLAA